MFVWGCWNCLYLVKHPLSEYPVEWVFKFVKDRQKTFVFLFDIVRIHAYFVKWLLWYPLAYPPNRFVKFRLTFPSQWYFVYWLLSAFLLRWVWNLPVKLSESLEWGRTNALNHRSVFRKHFGFLPRQRSFEKWTIIYTYDYDLGRRVWADEIIQENWIAIIPRDY